jgi:hypothetical protein
MADPVTKERTSAKKRTRYEDDYYSWINEQTALLRERRFDEVDIENVAEELSDLAKDEFAKLQSCLRVLLMHMLKWDQQPEHRTRSWVFSIREQRRRYARIMKQNPGLKPRLQEACDEAYEDARDWAANETHLQVREFPEVCPYGWKDILERPFEFDSVK